MRFDGIFFFFFPGGEVYPGEEFHAIRWSAADISNTSCKGEGNKIGTPPQLHSWGESKEVLLAGYATAKFQITVKHRVASSVLKKIRK